MTPSTEIEQLNAQLLIDRERLVSHWNRHPLSRFRHKKIIFVGAFAAVIWLSRYPTFRKAYLLSSLVTKTPFL